MNAAAALGVGEDSRITARRLSDPGSVILTHGAVPEPLIPLVESPRPNRRHPGGRQPSGWSRPGRGRWIHVNRVGLVSQLPASGETARTTLSPGSKSE